MIHLSKNSVMSYVLLKNQIIKRKTAPREKTTKVGKKKVYGRR